MKDKKQSAKVNYIWVLAGGYLVYLGFKLIRGAINGEASSPLIGFGAAALFVAVGAAVLLREWKAYKYGQEHIDDPETWSDDPEVLAEIAAEQAALEAAEEAEEVEAEEGEEA